ncbi:transcription elongation factor Spt5 [Thermofilum pendens]|uniref:Transcription elongation factor Spt5 n=1 Tax=Thermofilum pendens (strain DSM 2475 / Hrk 5) TaxID=368408 RepID=A1RX84_THEPD|nr:transcription elongation factor Spt5 [Thermofilum pendens]ABL77814.1 NusG antitermination factor [Thermofilum pendens Hrk 5]
MAEKPPSPLRFYALRVTSGQEYNVAQLLYRRAASGKYKVYSILVVPGLKGMVFVESDALYEAQRLAYGLKHVRGVVRGAVSLQEMEGLLKPKPLVDQLNVGDFVEIIRGPFTGMRGRIVGIDKSRNEVKVELAEAVFVLPVTINADDIKVIKRGGEA